MSGFGLRGAGFRGLGLRVCPKQGMEKNMETTTSCRVFGLGTYYTNNGESHGKDHTIHGSLVYVGFVGAEHQTILKEDALKDTRIPRMI